MGHSIFPLSYFGERIEILNSFPLLGAGSSLSTVSKSFVSEGVQKGQGSWVQNQVFEEHGAGNPATVYSEESSGPGGPADPDENQFSSMPQFLLLGLQRDLTPQEQQSRDYAWRLVESGFQDLTSSAETSIIPSCGLWPAPFPCLCPHGDDSAFTMELVRSHS